ncbi:uncharacterized protein [Ptychodera flava]|uniref:uncharacterized protein n=1 Tax=Ptychodera flava TaxID=63121 RepID=UPI00396AA7FE
MEVLPKRTAREQAIACDSCLQVLQLIYDEVTNNQTEAFAGHALGSFCNLLLVGTGLQDASVLLIKTSTTFSESSKKIWNPRLSVAPSDSAVAITLVENTMVERRLRSRSLARRKRGALSMI